MPEIAGRKSKEERRREEKRTGKNRKSNFLAGPGSFVFSPALAVEP
jgi:hypothetical protein